MTCGLFVASIWIICGLNKPHNPHEETTYLNKLKCTLAKNFQKTCCDP